MKEDAKGKKFNSFKKAAGGWKDIDVETFLKENRKSRDYCVCKFSFLFFKI